METENNREQLKMQCNGFRMECLASRHVRLATFTPCLLCPRVWFPCVVPVGGSREYFPWMFSVGIFRGYFPSKNKKIVPCIIQTVTSCRTGSTLESQLN